MERLSDLARGLAQIKIVGAQPAELLNILAQEGIDFWGVSALDQFTLLLKTRLKSCEKIKLLAEKHCCEAETVTLSGAPILLKRGKKRSVLWLLPLVAAALLAASSMFVWEIRVTGNEKVSETEILNVLEDCGVYIGSFHPTFVGDIIRSRAMREIPELKWISVSIIGCKALVEVREATKIPEVFENNDPIKLVAEQAGIIDRIEVLRGLACMKAGQTAAKGDVLVEAAVPSTFGDTVLVHALGTVKARTWYEISALMPTEYSQKDYTGEKKTRYALMLGKYRINFYRNSGIMQVNCDNIITEQIFGIKGAFQLPISLAEECSLDYNINTIAYTEEEIKAALEPRLISELKSRLGKDGEIVTSSVSFGYVNGMAVGTLRAECKQNIAAEKELSAEEISKALAEKGLKNSNEP